jgi:hypothetical protein
MDSASGYPNGKYQPNSQRIEWRRINGKFKTFVRRTIEANTWKGYRITVKSRFLQCTKKRSKDAGRKKERQENG